MAPDSRNSSATNWSVHEVLEWARTVRLPQSVLQALSENEVDGPTLVTLRQEELRTELGILSLPARRYFWDRIATLQKQQDTVDHAAALYVLDSEIKGLQVTDRNKPSEPDTASNGPKMIDAAAIALLQRDVEQQVRSASDHLCALRLHSTGNHSDFQSYEDFHTAAQEQLRLDRLSIMDAYDRSVALQLQQGNSSTASSVLSQHQQSSLFGLCIQACVRHRINVSRAFATGAAQPISRCAPAMTVAQKSPPALPARVGRISYVNSDSSTTKHSIAASKIPKSGCVPSTKEKRLFLKKLPMIEQCHVCFADNGPGFSFACEHAQCVDCMRQHLRVALHDRSLLPLKCCEIEIDMSVLPQMLLTPAEAALLASRTQEVSATNKMYCPNCSRFINLDLVDRERGAESILMCECRQLLCIECKTASHPALSCAENMQAATATDDALIRLAANEGWKQCPRCSIMIELSIGCYHMTCSNCTHEFCFRCLSNWNSDNATCVTGNCPVWDERRLLEAAETRVDAQLAAEALAPRAYRAGGHGLNAVARAGNVNPVGREQRVQHAMRALRGNEGCFHNWTRRGMRGRECERCGFYLWVYGMVCEGGCGITVCYTCAHHRIPRWGWR